MKTNFKRLLAVVLSALLLVSSFAIVAFADDEAVDAPAAPAAENLAASATVTADGAETTLVTDGDLETFYASEKALEVGYHKYGNEFVFTLAERSFVSEVVVSAYNWAAKNACTTFKVYVLVGEDWVYVATADMPTDSEETVITGAATFDAVMTDAVKVVAEAVGSKWMPSVYEVEIYAKGLGDDGYDDVAAEDWFVEAVKYVTANNIMTGVDEVLFAPNATLTNAMMAQIIYNMAGAPAVEADATFADVDVDAWYADAVAWAEANGIAAGKDGKFAPDAAIVRADIAAYLFNYAKYLNRYTADRADLAAFEDAADAAAAMKWAVSAGLFQGRSETELALNATATRAEVATVLERFAKMEVVDNYFRNVTVRGTVYASSYRGTATADKAIDGNAGTSSFWQPISEKADGKYTGTAYWGIKLEEAFDIDCVTLTVTNYKNWGTVAGVDYKVEGLVDGSWVTLATANDADAYAAGAQAVLTLKLDKLYTVTEVKVTATVALEEASYVKPTIYEINLNGIEAGAAEIAERTVANSTAGATAVGSTATNQGVTGEFAIDESATTAWMPLAEKDADGNFNGANLVLTWENAIAVRSIDVRVNNYASWMLETGVDYTVAALIDGKWVDLYSFNDTDSDDKTSPSVVFSKEFAALTTNSIKITASNYSSSVKPKIFDVKVNALGEVNYIDTNITSTLNVNGTFEGGANAWSGGFAQIFDDNASSTCAWTDASVLNITFGAASNFEFIKILATNHDPAAPGFWGDKDLILNIEIVCGEEKTVIEWSQRANSDDVENGTIAAKVDTSAFEGITAINITTKEACKWYSYVNEITFGNVEPVLVFN